MPTASVFDRIADGLAGPVPSPELAELANDWRRWLRRLFADYTQYPFAPHHAVLWDWLWAIEPGVRPDPLVAIWARGGAKSTCAEMATVALGARRKRRYGLYVSGTQDQANDHVSTIGAMLESRPVEINYSSLSARLVDKYGSSKGWTKSRLRTSIGFTVDAIGLDTHVRGVKLEDARPDFIILDDIDDAGDKVPMVERKIKTLTHGIIPAGSADVAILAIQNLIHPDSVFSRLADGRAEFLANRVVSGPIPAIEGLTWRRVANKAVITGGKATWEGQGIAACQAQLDDEAISAFLSERQHEVEALPGGMFDHVEFAHCRYVDLPDLVRIVVWVDPAVTDTDTSDSQGIQADGIDARGTIYRLWSWEQRTSPLDAMCRAIRKARELRAEAVGVETDQGGDTWASVYDEALRSLAKADPDEWGRPGHIPAFRQAKAGAGHGPKAHRAQQMLADYERGGRIIHVEGTHQVLERALRRFPRTKPLDLCDAAYWSWHDLRQSGGVSFLSALAPPCPACGFPNRRGSTQCGKCRREL
ncbi:MAG: hypothetical protein M3003_00900 [Candidatus Dormibacteraeota bacterium]|nr:hypothetical protein [Candidatus Dormibacteraeota bacterium]